MKIEERIVYNYFCMTETGVIVYEPNGKSTVPDFSIDSRIGVEVRRLNQNLFRDGDSQGLEDFAFPLWNAFVETLQSFRDEYKGESYWVGIEFQRSTESKIKEIKLVIHSALEDFLKSRITLPCPVNVNDDITLFLYEGPTTPGVLFRPIGNSDHDWGGAIVQMYVDNIRHSISEKKGKMHPCLSQYEELWLFLVDYIGGWQLLDKTEIDHVENSITDFGCFQRVSIVHADGQSLLSDLLPNNAAICPPVTDRFYNN